MKTFELLFLLLIGAVFSTTHDGEAYSQFPALRVSVDSFFVHDETSDINDHGADSSYAFPNNGTLSSTPIVTVSTFQNISVYW